MLFKNYNAQGSLEYLLMVGAAILVVAIVIIGVSGVIIQTNDQNVSSDYSNQMQDLKDLQNKSGDTTDQSNGPAIISFSINGVIAYPNGERINLVLPFGTNLSSLVPTITIRGLSVSPASGVQGDFSTQQIYAVLSQEGTTKSYIVNVSVANQIVCTGSMPLNSALCDRDNLGLNEDLSILLVDNCTTLRKCESICNSGFLFKNGSCEQDPLVVDCAGGSVTTITSDNKSYTLCTYKSNGSFTINKSLNVEVLVVGGGGAGGTDAGGGGGAGGVVYEESHALTNPTYNITVGTGGIGGPQFTTPTSGQNSIFDTITAIGGGRGAYYWENSAYNGGSGGGGPSCCCEAGTGNGTLGQGNAGSPSSGGGGAGAAGNGCAGGEGLYFSQFANIGGSPGGWFGGGGSGGCSETLVNGGGGRGNNWTTSLDPTCNGVINTGGGGGGGGGGSEGAYGCNGGSGIVIIKYQN